LERTRRGEKIPKQQEGKKQMKPNYVASTKYASKQELIINIISHIEGKEEQSRMIKQLGMNQRKMNPIEITSRQPCSKSSGNKEGSE
jgi:hypothetical protein